MSRLHFLRPSMALTALAGTSSLIGVSCGTAQSLPVVTMQFGWLASNGLLDEVAAQAMGYYKEEGVRLEITPGGPNVDGVARMASGQATVSQISSSPSIMLARSAGIPVKAIAAGR